MSAAAANKSKTSMEERILAGAAQVLRQLPLTKVTMDDIARSAGIARQTIYKHFSSKNEIVVGLFIAEIEQTHRPRIYELHDQRCDAAQLTAMILEQITMANGWIMLDRTFDPKIAPRIAELVLSSAELSQCNAQLWKPILRDYQNEGVVRNDVDLDRAVRWMTYQAVWFLSHPEALTRDPDERALYVRQFIVGALTHDDTTHNITTSSDDP